MRLLFPASRSSGIYKQQTTTVDMIYRSIDNISRNFEDVKITTTTTAKILPLKVVLRVTFLVPKLSVRVKSMTVVDIYTNYPLTTQLEVIPIRNIEQSHRQTTNISDDLYLIIPWN